MKHIDSMFLHDLEKEIGCLESVADVKKQGILEDTCPDTPDIMPIKRHKLSDLLPNFEGINYKDLGVFEDPNGKVVQKKAVVCLIDKIIEVAKEHASDICVHNGLPYMYNSHFWEQQDFAEFQYFLSRALLAMGYDAADAKHYKMKEELYKQFVSEAFRQEVKTDKTLINFTNGTFEISDVEQKLRPWSPDDMLKYELPFAYDENATAPLFEQYLYRVLPDKGCQDALSEFLGYVFIHSLKLEKALVLYGSGANGKSVMFDIVYAMLGEENVSTYSLDELMGEDSRYRAYIADRLLNYSSEMSGKITSDIFKKLVSIEPIVVRKIYKEPVTMRDYAKMMFNANDFPKGVKNTEAFKRRLLIIPFNFTVPEEERDPDLAKKIIETDLPGVFNWCLAGLKRLLKNKHFTESEIMRKQLDEFMMQSDTLLQFLTYGGYVKGEKQMLLKEFYCEYRQYCRSIGESPETYKKTSDRLEKDFGFKKGRVAAATTFFIEKGGSNG